MPGSPSFRVWVALLVLLHVALALLLWEPTMFEGGDNAGYMILGEGLRTGQGYRDLHLPGQPPHVKYPPLYPALLAVLGWLGGLQLFKAASLACTAGAVALAATLGRRLAGPAAGLAAAAVLAVNPVLLEYAHWVLSEAPFVFLVLASLCLSCGRSERERRLGLAAAAAAFLTRTAGLPLLLAALAVPALARRSRRTAEAAITMLVVAGGWSLYQRLAAPGRPGYLTEMLSVDPYDPGAGTAGASTLLLRGAENVWAYTAGVLPSSLGLGSAVPGVEASGPIVLVGLAVAGLALVGWIVRALRGLDHPELFACFYAGLIALWPSVWTDRRFLLPLLPLLLVYAALGARELACGVARRWTLGSTPGGRRLGASAAAAFALSLGIPGLLDATGRVPERLACLAGYRSGDPCVATPLASFYAAARWARDHTPPDAVIVNRKPTLFYWVARRRGDVYRFTAEPELVLAGLEAVGATHVVVDALSATTPRYLVPAIRAHRARFVLLYAEGEPPTAVLRFRPAPETALGPP